MFEKIDDAAVVHRLTGAAPTVAVHIPWDATADYGALAAYARGQGVAIGTVNANVFQDDAYMLGSVCHPDAGVAGAGPGSDGGVRPLGLRGEDRGRAGGRDGGGLG